MIGEMRCRRYKMGQVERGRVGIEEEKGVRRGEGRGERRR
jgi:hypothetical protein